MKTHPDSIYAHFSESRPYTKVIDIERSINGIVCGFEVSVRFCDGEPQEIDTVSAVESFDNGGRQILDKSKLAELNTLAKRYALENMLDIAEEIERLAEKAL